MTELGELMRQQITRGVAEVFRTQREIIDHHLYQEGRERTLKIRHNGREIHDQSGALRDMLRNPDYHVAVTGGGVVSTATIPLRLRFFDMKHLGNWRVYNRQVWGIMYYDVLRNIKYTTAESLRDTIYKRLKSGE